MPEMEKIIVKTGSTPTYSSYPDKGCEYAPSCLNCPFTPDCLFEVPAKERFAMIGMAKNKRWDRLPYPSDNKPESAIIRGY